MLGTVNRTGYPSEASFLKPQPGLGWEIAICAGLELLLGILVQNASLRGDKGLFLKSTAVIVFYTVSPL